MSVHFDPHDQLPARPSFIDNHPIIRQTMSVSDGYVSRQASPVHQEEDKTDVDPSSKVELVSHPWENSAKGSSARLGADSALDALPPFFRQKLYIYYIFQPPLCKKTFQHRSATFDDSLGLSHLLTLVFPPLNRTLCIYDLL